MTTGPIRFTVTFACWLMPYLYGLRACVWLTGLPPDWDKAGRMCKRAVRVKIIVD